jgi:phosphatidylserine/phosphatidylglycerophosphate/cardiolipin synthase-like enzyme
MRFNKILLLNFCIVFGSIVPKVPLDPRICMQYLATHFRRGRVAQKFSSRVFDLKQLVVGLIYAESASIDASIYMLTDDDVAKALIHARARGVQVRVITEGSTAYDAKSKIPFLLKNKIPVHISPSKRGSIMHLKDVLFGRNVYGLPIALTGSANLTGGMTNNIETISLLVDSSIFAQSRQEFEGLRKEIITGWK